MTLKYESIGKLLINKIKAYLALFILLPYIEPLRSSRNTYYPFAEFISTSNILPYKNALYASFMLSGQNLGMKESIAVELLSLLPKTQLGR